MNDYFRKLMKEADEIQPLPKKLEFLLNTREMYKKSLLPFLDDPHVKRGIMEFDIKIECIKEKMKNLPLEKSKKNVKTPKLNDYNKPVLNQKQISILFKLFKDRKIFNNRDIDKTDFAKIISELTGYSENTLRQNFSKENIVISDNPSDYKTISVKLKEVITIIEKLEKEITTKDK